MLNKYIALAVASSLAIFSFPVVAKKLPSICNSPNYTCKEVRPGRVVAIPRQHDGYYEPRNNRYESYDSYDQPEGKKVSYRGSIPNKISTGNMIKVDLGRLTWAAYDYGGNLVNSGRVSGGKAYCPDIGRRCRTVTGTFTIYSKKGAGCKSSRFPVGKGGAPMPYCMFFHGGYALHGSNAVPAHNASHGCVRMPPQEAQWLNQDFVQVGRTRVNIHY